MEIMFLMMENTETLARNGRLAEMPHPGDKPDVVGTESRERGIDRGENLH